MGIFSRRDYVFDADDVITASIQKIEIMIKIFDYIFFRAIAFYKNHHDYDPEFAGVVVVVAFQFLLFIDLLILLNLAKLFYLHTQNSKMYLILFVLFLLIPNSIRYMNRNIQNKIKQNWCNERDKKSLHRLLLLSSFIILSVVLLFIRGGRLG